MFIFLKDLFLGKAGLAKTYWLWGVLGGLVVGAGYYAASYAAVKLINNDILFNVLSYGYPLFAIAWTIFICIAIINSSTYKRKRGIWGWIASILASIGLIRSVYATAVLFSLLPVMWRDFKKA